MKKSLLELVKQILSDADSQDVNSISDTQEALQAAATVQSVWEDMVANRVIPEHQSLGKLTSLSDSERPTHFVLEDSQHRVMKIWYDTSSDNSYAYTEVTWLEPLDFLEKIDRRQDDYQLVEDMSSGTKLRIGNESAPKFYTSFDDEHIVMDSFNSSVSSTLTSGRTRVIVTVYPTFTLSDDFVPDLDSNMFPYLLRESTSMFFDLYKGAVSSKVEQAAKRHKNYIQNDKQRIGSVEKKRRYGRR